jgi:hypothetical protein
LEWEFPAQATGAAKYIPHYTRSGWQISHFRPVRIRICWYHMKISARAQDKLRRNHSWKDMFHYRWIYTYP